MKLSSTVKQLSIRIGVVSLFFIAAGAMYYRSVSIFPFAVGVLLMTLINIIKVILLERGTLKAVDFDTEDAKYAGNYMRMQYLLRYLLTGAALVAAALLPQTVISIWGAAAGIFTLQIAVLSIKFFAIKEAKITTGSGETE